jgi:hypothetical protein
MTRSSHITLLLLLLLLLLLRPHTHTTINPRDSRGMATWMPQGPQL